MPISTEADPAASMRDCETQLRTAEVDAVTAFVAEADNLMSLAGDIKTCHEALHDVETLLDKYQKDLGAVSIQIKDLQSRSSKMHVQIQNRKTLQQSLGSFIDRMAVSPSLIHAIMEAAPESDSFLEALRHLDRKLRFIASDEQARTSVAYRDVAPELERLKVAAISRGREAVVSSIRSILKPRSSSHRKETNIAAFRAIVSFLRSHGAVVYEELRSAYVEKIALKYLEIFKSYWACIERCEEARVMEDHLLGAPETSASSIPSVTGMLSMLGNIGGSSTSASLFSSSSSSSWGARGGGETSWFASSAPQGPLTCVQAFSLGDRAKILARVDAPPQVLRPTETSDGQRFTFEVLFRSLTRLLTDVSSHEYLFCSDVWGPEGRTVYRETFASSIEFVQASLASALQEMFDPIAILLALRINRQYALLMSRRSIPSLDDHFDAVNMLLWPRLKLLLDRQLDSLRSMPIDVTDPSLAVRVHPVSERYAALTEALLALHGEFVDGPLSGNIERLRYTLMDLLLRVSRSFPQRGKGTVFLIHNFGHVLRVLRALVRRMPLQTERTFEDMGYEGHRMPSSSSDTARSRSRASAGKLTTASSDRDDSSESNIDVEERRLGSVGCAVLQAFEESLLRATSLYVETRLTAGAPQLMTFVKRGEAAAATISEGTPVPGYGPSEGAPVARDFSTRWEKIVEVLHAEIRTDFGSGSVGKEVQQAAFTQLLLVWSRFLDLMKRQGDEGIAVAQGAVTVPSIMFALRQHKFQF